MDDLPLVTIAIPTFNRLNYLKQALQSALAQTYQNIEILVSDNASTDGTQMFMRQIQDTRVRYIRHSENLGMFENWNFLLTRASGQYFLLLSDDDLLFENAIMILISLIKDNTSLSFSYGRFNFIDQFSHVKKISLSSIFYQSSENFLKEWLMGKRQIVPSLTLFKIKSMDSYEKNTYKYVSDVNSWFNLILRGANVYSSNELLGSYRVHSESASKVDSYENWIQDYLNLFKKYSSFDFFKQLNLFFIFFVLKNVTFNILKFGFFTKSPFQSATKNMLIEFSYFLYILSLILLFLARNMIKIKEFYENIINKSKR